MNVGQIIQSDYIFREFKVNIPDNAWTPCGPDEDERSLLTVTLIVNGSRMYLEAYAVHTPDDCDALHESIGIDPHDDTITHGAVGDLTAFDRLAEAHGVKADVQTIVIANRLYAMFAEPAGA